MSSTNAPRGINRRLTVNVTPALLARFWAAVDRGDEEECWDWTRAFRNGYGAIKHERHVHSAHVIAFVLANGPVPDGLIVGHKCDNSGCCNPKHLEAITPQKNNADARRRGASRPCGEQIANAKLTESLVARIWVLHRQGLGAVRIGRELGITQNTAKRVLSGRGWRHLMPNWAKSPAPRTKE
jgi:hypothetical protein